MTLPKTNFEIAYRNFTKKRFPLPSEKQVADLENRLGVPLPPDYRRFLLENNGGVFLEPETKDCLFDRLTWMAGIGAPDSLYEFASKAWLATFDDNDPPQIVPGGYTMMGNLLLVVVDPDGDDYGMIFLKKAYSDESIFLANGIEDFFGLLREPLPDDLAANELNEY